MQPNTLYFGDNLQVLRTHFPDESVDLVYLDPPFNSKRDYNYIYRDLVGAGDTAQEQAFTDTWTMEGAAAEFREVTESGLPEGALIETLRQVFGDTSLVAYLSVMALRLRELHRVLKPTGSLYLHCDPTASHYLKMVLDCVFGGTNFINDVTWQRTVPKSDHRQGATNWPRVHDCLLYYQRHAGTATTFQQAFSAYDADYLEASYPFVEEGTGRRYGAHSLTAPGAGTRGHPQYEFMGVVRYWRYGQDKMQALLEEGRIIQSKPGNVPRFKRYLDEMPGVPVGDIWTDIGNLQGAAHERLGYPTQKPLALLERIILASSNEGDLCLDPFCGCGTAVAAAQKLGRQWCGIDITSLAVTLIRERLSDHFPEVYPSPGDVPVDGLPKDVAAARMLFEKDPYDFQFWALTLVAAHPPGGTKTKGSDKGIDGVVLWHDGEEKLQRAIVSVKGGKHVSDAMLKDLIATVEAEKAAVGLFVTLTPPTKPMRERAALAGEYELAGTTAKFPRVQILTIEELLAGKRPSLPQTSQVQGHKAAKAIEDTSAQGSLFGEDEA